MTASELADRIRRMPKAELHIHLEGALRWSTVREFNPQARLLDSPPWLGKPFASSEEFRGIFREYLIPASGTEERIERHMFELLEGLARQNVRYAEPILYLPFHMAQGLGVAEVLGAVQRGMLRAEREHAIVCRLIIGLNRAREANEQAALAREAIEFRKPDGTRLVAGLDVMSDDRFGVDAVFAELYRDAKPMGLRLKVHAGELGGPEIVRDALEKLGASHLSHGVGASTDPGLLRELAASRNLVPRLPNQQHPAGRRNRLRHSSDQAIVRRRLQSHFELGRSDPVRRQPHRRVSARRVRYGIFER